MQSQGAINHTLARESRRDAHAAGSSLGVGPAESRMLSCTVRSDWTASRCCWLMNRDANRRRWSSAPAATDVLWMSFSQAWSRDGSG
jgi:hypothetical protein